MMIHFTLAMFNMCNIFSNHLKSFWLNIPPFLFFLDSWCIKTSFWINQRDSCQISSHSRRGFSCTHKQTQLRLYTDFSFSSVWPLAVHWRFNPPMIGWFTYSSSHLCCLYGSYLLSTSYYSSGDLTRGASRAFTAHQAYWIYCPRKCVTFM